MDINEQIEFLEQIPQKVGDTPTQNLPNRPGEQPWSWVFEELGIALREFQTRPTLPYKDE